MRDKTKKRKKINPISDRKYEVMAQEVPIKKLLIIRAGGVPRNSNYHKGILIDVKCEGGTCYYCGLGGCYPTFHLEPHEKHRKSGGGKVTLENTVYICRTCHLIQQQYIKDDAAIRLIMSTRQTTKEEATIILKRIREKK